MDLVHQRGNYGILDDFQGGSKRGYTRSGLASQFELQILLSFLGEKGLNESNFDQRQARSRVRWSNAS